MSSADLAQTIARLERLSEDRAKQVLSLVQDLSDLEALENVVDLKAAHEALAETEEPVDWERVKARLDEQFGVTQPAS